MTPTKIEACATSIRNTWAELRDHLHEDGSDVALPGVTLIDEAIDVAADEMIASAALGRVLDRIDRGLRCAVRDFLGNDLWRDAMKAARRPTEESPD